MNYYYITGTSRGMGKALAELLLQDDENYVLGLSRSQSIEHPNYEHVSIDLSDPKAVAQFEFIDIMDADSICLVNNSGSLGQLAQIGKLDNRAIAEALNLNAVAPLILTNNFVRQYQQLAISRVVLHVSSGAARFPIVSWSTYGSGKAALDMNAQVLHAEQQRDYVDNPVRVFSVAPGIVATQMQEEIREVPEEQFGEVGKFKMFHEKGYLLSPEKVALRFADLLQNPQSHPDPIVDFMAKK